MPPERQAQRLGPIFGRLASVLDEDREAISFRDDPSSIAPERALMLEVAGSSMDFQALVARVNGLEFLGDEETGFEPDDDFFEIDTRKDRKGKRRTDRSLGGRLYRAMPDVEALRQSIALWGRWQRSEDLPQRLKSWRDVCASLRDVRRRMEIMMENESLLVNRERSRRARHLRRAEPAARRSTGGGRSSGTGIGYRARIRVPLNDRGARGTGRNRRPHIRGSLN